MKPLSKLSTITLTVAALSMHSCYVLPTDCLEYDLTCNPVLAYALNTSLNHATNPSCTATAACPTDYVKVPCNPDVGTTADFCLAKYEMKNVGSVATSQAALAPWATISQDTARTECSNLGTGYHLVTNSEWMTIARNIETTASNWSTGTVNSGNLARGWAANTSVVPVDAWQNTAVAPSTGAGCLYNTALNACGAGGAHLYRRTHSLSNGEEIWDISGNVWEWVDWQVAQAEKATGSGGTLSWSEYPTVSSTAAMTTSTWQASNSALTSTHGLGQYFKGSVDPGGSRRGGGLSAGATAGVLALALNNSPATAVADLGFRCARQ